MGEAGFKLWSSYGEFTLDNRQLINGLSKTERMVRSSARSMGTEFSRANRSFDSAGTSMSRSARAVGEAASHGASGIHIFEKSVKSALKGTEGLDKGSRHLIHGLTQVAAQGISVGLAFGLLPGLILAATSAISAMFDHMAEGAEEAIKKNEELGETLKKLGELEDARGGLRTSTRGAAAARSGAIDAAGKAEADAKVIEAMREQLKNAEERKAEAIKAKDDDRQGVAQREIDALSKSIADWSMVVSRDVNTFDQESRARIEEAQVAVSNAINAGDATAEAKARGELATILKEVIASLVGFAGQQDTAGTSRQNIADLANLAQLNAANLKSAQARAGTGDDSSVMRTVEESLDEFFDEVTKGAEQLNEKLAQDMKAYDRRTALLGKTPLEQDAIKRSQELEDLLAEGARLGKTQPELDAIKKAFMEMVEVNESRLAMRGAGFMGLQDANRSIQQQVLTNDPMKITAKAAQETAANTKKQVDQTGKLISAVKDLVGGFGLA